MQPKLQFDQLYSSSPQKPPQTTMSFQRQLRVAWQWDWHSQIQPRRAHSLLYFPFVIPNPILSQLGKSLLLQTFPPVTWTCGSWYYYTGNPSGSPKERHTSHISRQASGSISRIPPKRTSSQPNRLAPPNTCPHTTFWLNELCKSTWQAKPDISYFSHYPPIERHLLCVTSSTRFHEHTQV